MATPMQETYPVISDWVAHKTVSTDKLREELTRALAWVVNATDGCCTFCGALPGHQHPPTGERWQHSHEQREA